VNKYITILLLCCCSFVCFAQSEDVKKDKKLEKLPVVENASESVVFKKDYDNKSISDKETSRLLRKSKPHSTTKAWIMSALLPGLGQVYNDQWYKVPVIYGAFAGIIYGINWNTNAYNDYKNAYSDYVNYLNLKADGKNPAPTGRWEDVSVIKDVSDFDKSTEEWFRTSLKNRKDYHKRNRDLTYIAFGGLYFLNIIDALVAAHFYDFDISDDLSMSVRPSVDLNPNLGNNFSLSCSIKF
jgi:hypothetical protein